MEVLGHQHRGKYAREFGSQAVPRIERGIPVLEDRAG
jgi:hypothetical protein